MTDPEADQVVQCLAGDVDAFETLYRTHSARIYTLACRMTGSSTQGEDLLQEIFLHAYQRLASFKGDATFGTWLYRLAINRCLDFLRSREMKAARATDALQPPDVPVDADPSARLDLERAIRQLPVGYREVFVLHDVEGFDHKEIARLLGIADGTSRSQLFKARMQLRTLLRCR